MRAADSQGRLGLRHDHRPPSADGQAPAVRGLRRLLERASGAERRPGPERTGVPGRRRERGAAAPVLRPGLSPGRRRGERARGDRGRACRQGPGPPRRTARDRRRVRLLPGHPVLLRGLRPVRGGSRGGDRRTRGRDRAVRGRRRARASSTAAGASGWRTPTWPSRGSGRARSTPRSRPWRPCWPCRRASARRCRASACPWSGPSWPGRSTAVRRRPASSPSSWPGSIRGSSADNTRPAEDGGHRGLHDRERSLAAVGERLAAADHQGVSPGIAGCAPRPDAARRPDRAGGTPPEP